MKRFIHASLFSLITLVCLSSPVLAHPGNTNSSGCHTQESTGYYHCHNDPDNVTENNETGDLTGEYDDWKPFETQVSNSSKSWFDILIEIVCCGVILLMAGGIMISAFNWIGESSKKAKEKQRDHASKLIQEPSRSLRAEHEISSNKKKYNQRVMKTDLIKLEEMIIETMQSSSKPLKAREIKTLVNKKYKKDYTRKDINHVLYSTLKKKVTVDSNFCWKLN